MALADASAAAATAVSFEVLASFSLLAAAASEAAAASLEVLADSAYCNASEALFAEEDALNAAAALLSAALVSDAAELSSDVLAAEALAFDEAALSAAPCSDAFDAAALSSAAVYTQMLKLNFERLHLLLLLLLKSFAPQLMRAQRPHEPSRLPH